MRSARALYRVLVVLSLVGGLALYAADDPVTGTLVIFAGLLLTLAVSAARAVRSAGRGRGPAAPSGSG